MSTSTNGTKIQPNEEQKERVTSKISEVRNRIEKASKDAKRNSPPRLVAISKLHPPSSILAAHKNDTIEDQIHFGENYAQELEAKAKVLPTSIRWHFVGKLQSNKAKLVANIPNLYLIETVDSIKLANAIEKIRSNLKEVDPLGVYLQVNTSGEENKGGLAPLLNEKDVEGSELFNLAKHIIEECKALRLAGLMTIGSATNSKANREQQEVEMKDQTAEEIAAQARSQNPDFDTLYTSRKVLVNALRTSLDQSKVGDRYSKLVQATEQNSDHSGAWGGLELSMGMSNDLEVAVRAGSNNVRVGTDCFGVRPASRDEAMEGMKDELEG